MKRPNIKNSWRQPEGRRNLPFLESAVCAPPVPQLESFGQETNPITMSLTPSSRGSHARPSVELGKPRQGGLTP